MNEYVIDMFSQNLEAWLNYIHTNQRHLQQKNAEQMGVDFVLDYKNIYLLASFLSSNQWAFDQITDLPTVAASFEPPTFFITITCNSSWPKIQSHQQKSKNLI